MSEYLYLNCEPVKAWQNLYNNPMPPWVKRIIRYDGPDAILLDRKSGLQEVRYGEWIIQSLDGGEPQWITDAMRMRDYK